MATVATESDTAHDDHHGHHDPHLAHHFESHEQQFDSGKLGIWLFLVTEVLFFSGLFVFYILYRFLHPEVFEYAHHFLDKKLGAVNTIVLLFSSLTMAWAVRCAQLNQRKGLIVTLIITLVCAGAFMVVKYFEYTHKFHNGTVPAGLYSFDPTSEEGKIEAEHVGVAGEEVPKNVGVFFSIYFCMTGLHGIHIVAGMIAITWLLVRAFKGHFNENYFGPVDFVGLYWHLVDLIWIYLFPLLYLIN